MLKVIKKISILLFIPVTLTLKLLNPLIKIRWATRYFSDRIGHLVAEMEHYLYFANKKPLFTFDIFPSDLFYNSNPSNNFLQKHYRKKILTINKNLIILLQKSQKIIESTIPLIKFDNFDNLLSPRDKFQIFTKKFKPSINFNNFEIQEIKKKIKKIGLKKNQKFICLIVRDNRYLKSKLNFNTSYHDYRDSDIKDYEKGIKYLIKKGYFVFRMGKLQKKKINILNKNFIDYAFSKYRSDILDVWLMANCNFCISTGTGLDHISRIFKRPILYLNQIPIKDWSSHIKSLTYPKSIYRKKGKKFLNFEDYLKHSYHTKKEYLKNEIEIVDLKKTQILNGIKEFLSLMNYDWKISINRMEKQKKFNRKFKKTIKIFHPNIDFHENIHKNSLISLNFLNKIKL